MDTDQLYQERLRRYLTALRNEKPDKIPIRPFVAEFTARYAGMTSQQVAHDYNLAFEAAVKCAKDFDWDAVVPNMVYVWTGLAQAAGLRYYGIPSPASAARGRKRRKNFLRSPAIRIWSGASGKTWKASATCISGSCC